MNEIQHRRGADNLAEGSSVALGSDFKIRRFHWHGMDMLRAEWDPCQQAFAQVGEISVRVSSGGDALVDLYQMHRFPRDFFTGEGPQHKPGRVPAADAKNESAARGHRLSSVGRDDRCRLVGDCVGIGKDFNYHGRFSTCPPNWKRMADSSLS